MTRGGPGVGWRAQIDELDPKVGRNGNEYLDRDVARRALDPSDAVRPYAYKLGEYHLTEALSIPQCFHISTDVLQDDPLVSHAVQNY